MPQKGVLPQGWCCNVEDMNRRSEAMKTMNSQFLGKFASSLAFLSSLQGASLTLTMPHSHPFNAHFRELMATNPLLQTPPFQGY